MSLSTNARTLRQKAAVQTSGMILRVRALRRTAYKLVTRTLVQGGDARAEAPTMRRVDATPATCSARQAADASVGAGRERARRQRGLGRRSLLRVYGWAGQQLRRRNHDLRGRKWRMPHCGGREQALERVAPRPSPNERFHRIRATLAGAARANRSSSKPARGARSGTLRRWTASPPGAALRHR